MKNQNRIKDKIVLTEEEFKKVALDSVGAGIYKSKRSISDRKSKGKNIKSSVESVIDDLPPKLKMMLEE